jgi:transcription-repair coupling factor (superfamily II helicase)
MSDATTEEISLAPLSQLAQKIEAHVGFEQWMANVQPGRLATLDEVWGSARALVAAVIASKANGPLLVVCPDTDLADEFSDELALFSSARCMAFPAWESDPGERLVHDEVFGDRLRLLKTLLASEDVALPDVVVTSIQSLLQPVPSRAQLNAMSRRISAGDTVDADELLGWLVANGLHRTSAVELPGECAARGGIIDIFSADWDGPVRIELFGDEVESLRQFDVATQRSTSNLREIEITIVAANDDAQTPLVEFLPGDTQALLIEPVELREAAAQYLRRTERPDAHLSYSMAIELLARFRTISVEALATAAARDSLALPIQSVERFTGDISKVRDQLDAVGGNDEVYVVCLTEAEVKRVGEILVSTNANKEGRLHFPIGRLKTGFRLSEEAALVISGSELFHRQEIHRPSRRRLGRAIDSFTELHAGDLVVHLSHGIGRYRGLKLLERESAVEEHLTIEFQGGTKVYVPASKIGLVQKYVGSTKGSARLAKIGGQRWASQKKAAESSVTDLAVEMLELQAARRARPGIRFPDDSFWQQEFDSAFPYHETPDQLTTMVAIKQDMCQPRPMDRLLCGDVGFGKTELSIRAAFKAVDSGYQVGVLVPTTVLAEQHLRTFQNRMAEFPIEIASLSRFSTRKQQSKTIERLANGQIDVVIGTHRLAQTDVRFQNLGLVIIDEEQRFGVEIKERLKQVRQTVDVLTMTATPIPRTLHLSLIGARDISNLETAPEDRLAVETRVTRFKPELIRHAIMRELNRNGQVFFVHNRVHDIANVAAKLQEIVPEARIGIGHGQMPETKLEKVMFDFVNHQFDVLLATTIIESGLDIPNANTIFIDDADQYGLADLHQLRGRVGRYKHRAYCYLLVDPRKHLSPTAAKRLRAIEEFSDMGAGFAIAMRDLEIRGAGNILGTQQSGHIAAVGYEFYCQLLDNAVRVLRHQPPNRYLDVDIDLPGEAHLPDEYVPDMKLKLDLYRRLARVTSNGQLRDIESELVDRFGAPPDAAQRLLALCSLRIDAAVWAIQTIHIEDGYVVFGYSDKARIEQLRQQSDGRLRVVDGQSAYLPIGKRVTDAAVVFQAVQSLLHQ